MKMNGTSYLFNVKNLRKKFEKSHFFTKNSFCQKQKLRKIFHKILNISESTEPISSNLVLNESL